MLDDEGLSAPVTSGGPRARRRWPVAEKRRIVLESFEAGASVSVVARRHDVNANQVFAWRKLYWDGLLGGGGLVPVAVVASGSAVAKAMDYILRHWTTFSAFLDDVRIRRGPRTARFTFGVGRLGQAAMMSWTFPFAGLLFFGKAAPLLNPMKRSEEEKTHDGNHDDRN